MAEYKITTPSVIRIKGLQPTDIHGMHSLFKQEGCIDSENKFSDEEKCIALDDVQTRLSKQYHTDKQASADMLLCIAQDKYILVDAKFNSETVKNISPTELNQKLLGSKSLVLSDEVSFGNAFYVLFKSKVLTPTQESWLKRHLTIKPQFRFMTAIKFRGLFE